MLPKISGLPLSESLSSIAGRIAPKSFGAEYEAGRSMVCGLAEACCCCRIWASALGAPRIAALFDQPTDAIALDADCAFAALGNATAAQALISKMPNRA